MPCSITGNAVTASALTSTLGVGAGGTGATTAAGAADNLSVVKRDHGHNNIGSFCFALRNNTTTVSPGGTIAGSGLYAAGLYSTSFALDAFNIANQSPNCASIVTNVALGGTWRCLGSSVASTALPGGEAIYPTTLWQRIA